MKIILILLSFLTLNNCNSTKIASNLNQKQQNSQVMLNGEYIVKTLRNEDVTKYNLELNFVDTEQKVNGFSGCNRFFGNYSYHSSNLSFSPLASTKMFCSEDNNKIESKFLEVLSTINHIKRNDSIIELISNSDVVLTMVKKQKNTNIAFEYSALSRGFYKLITINKKEITVINKRNTKPIIKTCSDNAWENIINTLKTVDLENIPNLKAPTENRFFDGAAIANLKITINGTTYETASFDHGHPPKEIEPLVKEILSISENIE
ncbi:META domain-containing protein [Yeosuana marina]|uniref:META domain-containing protein n=1 Tax=Yeosuana marina TaxID=1565536 RepID=UPI0030EDFFB7|tara:strand:- start:18057 stop:18845 length:789 start_codon:yes stop_codon:yes gene_type:complete